VDRAKGQGKNLLPDNWRCPWKDWASTYRANIKLSIDK